MEVAVLTIFWCIYSYFVLSWVAAFVICLQEKLTALFMWFTFIYAWNSF